MFDPLSNFKLNKILSAVNALPTTLASSFTEVKNAIAGVQTTTNTIDGKVNTINTNVGNLVNEPFYDRNLIIPKSDLLNFKYVSNNFTNGSGIRNVLNVSGSGALLMAHVKMESPLSNNTTYCDIVIDGKTIKLNRTSGNSTLMLSNVGYANLFGIDMSGFNPIPNYLSYSEINNGVTFTNQRSVLRLFDGYIGFNNSLSVTSYKNESDSACFVNVELIYALS